MERAGLEALYTLYLIEGIGSQRAIALREHFGSAERALGADPKELLAIHGFGEQTVASFVNDREEAASRARNDLASLGSDAECITYFDERYPVLLRSVYPPPVILFVRGNADLLDRDRSVAVVGTRRITEYGQSVTEELCRGLAQAGVCVVSGFAAGVDTASHRAAYDGGGETVAVLGSGIDIIYPAGNKKFAEELIASRRGVLVSDFPVGTPPDAKNFPSRNRIVSGLARACVVVESTETGGSMITAELALDQGRVLYAIPGDINRPTSMGPNLLLASGRARPIRGSRDALKDLGWDRGELSIGEPTKYRNRDGLTLTESAVVELLDSAGIALHIDVLSERSSLKVQDLLVVLLDLEFRDVVRQLQGKYFSTIF